MKKYLLLTLAILATILVFVFLLNQLEPVSQPEPTDCGLEPIAACEAVEAFFRDTEGLRIVESVDQRDTFNPQETN